MRKVQTDYHVYVARGPKRTRHGYYNETVHGGYFIEPVDDVEEAVRSDFCKLKRVPASDVDSHPTSECGKVPGAPCFGR